MGKPWTKFKRSWNVEGRAFRELERHEKGRHVAAPKHPTSNPRTLIDEYPELIKDYEKQDQNVQLNEWIKKVRLDSSGPPDVISKRKLPENRKMVEDHEYGYAEPTIIPRGKCSLRQALEFITKYQENPTGYTHKEIAQEYNMEEEEVKVIIKHFQALTLHLPPSAAKDQLEGKPLTAKGKLGFFPLTKKLPDS